MKNFADPNLRQTVIKELEAAAQAIAAKYGMTATRGHGTYDRSMLKLPMEFSITELKAEKAASYASVLGLPENVIGSQFKHNTKTFTVTDLNPKAPKFCILIQDQNGKGFKCSVKQYLDMIKR